MTSTLTRTLLALLASLLLCAPTASRAANPTTAPATAPAPYTDPSLPVAARVADLLKRLTTEQKAAQLQSTAPAIKELNLPACNFYSEAGHGLYQAGRATCFPIPMGMAASWDAKLINRAADAISDEARANFDSGGSKFRGLIFFSPEIDLARDPRWGRCQEVYGEDPHLTAQMAGAFIRGLQGDDPKYLKSAAIIKHFAMYGQEVGRFNLSFNISERTLREYYLAPFHDCAIESRALGIMTAFNGINDVPCVANPLLLKTILRDDWHFPGIVTTDNNAPNTLITSRRFVSTNEESVSAILNAGVDILVGGQPNGQSNWAAAIVASVNSGAIKPEVLDSAVSYALTARFRLGLMDDKAPFSNIPRLVIASKEHLDLAQQIAAEGMVLLKNDPAPKGYGFGQLLPIDLRRIKSIAVVGPYARIPQSGAYAPAGGNALSPLEAITAAVGDRITVKGSNPASIPDSVEVAASCDVAIVVMGLTNQLEHEGIDRTDIELPDTQRIFLDAIVKANPITIVVLQGGSAINISWIKEHCPAILMAWYPGEMGGPALASVLLGQTNPAGRLPLTFYRSAADLPPMTDYEISKGRTYMYLPADKPATYPFGFGLSYTQFTYANLHLNPIDAAKKSLTLSIDITNTGPRDGDEVPQLYIRKTQSTITRPIKQLKGFQRLNIPKGQTKNVQFTLPLSELAIWDEASKSFLIEPGAYEVLIGASSQDIRARQTFQVK